MAKIGNFEVLVGCDPEFWVKNTYTGKIESAHGMVEGTKAKPLPVKGGQVQVDGMALEIGIDPAKTMTTFNNNLDKVFDGIKGLIPKHYEFVYEPVAEFGKAYIDKQPEEAKILGCEPDYNAYTGGVNPRPDGNKPFRTASGHIHISWKKDDPEWPDVVDPLEPSHFEACCMFAKVLDAYLGIPSLAWDRDVKRRELYGAPGCFRPKFYGNGWLGMEYRVLSNKWLAFPQARDLVFGNTIDAFTQLLKDADLPDRKYQGKTAKEILELGNDADRVNTAARVMKYGDNFIKSPAYYRKKCEDK